MDNLAATKLKFAHRPIILLMLTLSAGLLSLSILDTSSACSKLVDKQICLEVVITQSDQQIGMSKYSSYSCGRGMLFDFGTSGYYSIWMKDTKFPLDISWLDSNKTVVKVENNVSPDTYPKTFTSDRPASYVLETYPGCYELNVGSKLTN